MTTLEQCDTWWFCETCMDTTPHKRIYNPKLKRKTYQCTQCGEQFTRNYEETKWAHRKRTRKYRYTMKCTHCSYEWNTKSLKQPKSCPKCNSKHIKIVCLTRHWRHGEEKQT